MILFGLVFILCSAQVFHLEILLIDQINLSLVLDDYFVGLENEVFMFVLCRNYYNGVFFLRISLVGLLVRTTTVITKHLYVSF